MRRSPPIRRPPRASLLRPLQTARRRYAIDERKSRADFGFAPRLSFEAGFAETLAWYLANEGWWRPLLERRAVESAGDLYPALSGTVQNGTWRRAMPALKYQIDFEPQAPVTTSPTTPVVGDVVALGDSVAFSESPARILHERLSDHFETNGTVATVVPDTRWSGAARVAFILGAAIGLWAAIGTVAVALIA